MKCLKIFIFCMLASTVFVFGTFADEEASGLFATLKSKEDFAREISFKVFGVGS